MSFDGHVFIRFPGDCDVDDVVTAGEAESGDRRTSSEEVRSPSSQSPGNLIKTLRLKGEGKLKEDDSEDDLDDSSLSSWHSRDNPKDPKEGNLKVSSNLSPCFNIFSSCCNSYMCLGIKHLLSLATSPWQISMRERKKKSKAGQRENQTLNNSGNGWSSERNGSSETGLNGKLSTKRLAKKKKRTSNTSFSRRSKV